MLVGTLVVGSPHGNALQDRLRDALPLSAVHGAQKGMPATGETRQRASYGARTSCGDVSAKAVCGRSSGPAVRHARNGCDAPPTAASWPIAWTARPSRAVYR
jgi:hypothetical protein